MKTKITSPEDLRAVLLESIVGVLEQKINVSQANVIAALSSEVHKSIRQEFDILIYSNKNIGIKSGVVVKKIKGENK